MDREENATDHAMEAGGFMTEAIGIQVIETEYLVVTIYYCASSISCCRLSTLLCSSPRFAHQTCGARDARGSCFDV
jgi:hypothetical protein